MTLSIRKVPSGPWEYRLNDHTHGYGCSDACDLIGWRLTRRGAIRAGRRKLRRQAWRDRWRSGEWVEVSPHPPTTRNTGPL